jgi:kinesin family protein C1
LAELKAELLKQSAEQQAAALEAQLEMLQSSGEQSKSAALDLAQQEKKASLERQKATLESQFETQKAQAIAAAVADLRATLESTADVKVKALEAQAEGRHQTALTELTNQLSVQAAAERDAAVARVRFELEQTAGKDRETALSMLRAELDAESKHARDAAVREAEVRAAEARRLAHEQGDQAVQNAEERAAQHKARLDGVIAQLDSEKEEVCRVKRAADAAAQLAQAEKAAVVARAEAAERATKEVENAAAQLRSEVASMRAAQGQSEEKRNEMLVLANKEIDNVRRQLAEEQTRIAAEEAAIAATNDRVKELEDQLLDADETRRQLHNQIQELRGNVRVFARTRPPAPGGACAVKTIDVESMSITDRLGDDAVFSFDKCFGPEARQEDIFEDVSQLVQSALDGYKVCLFSYGQTGSGKTHTMLGAGEGDQRGIIPRAVQKVLEHAEQLSKKGYEYTMEASYVEIYNEQVRDLLKPGADHDEKHKIVSAPEGGCPTVSGVEREPVRSVDAAAGLVRRAAAARAVEATQMNAQSSRSHTLFLLYITGRHPASGQLLNGCLNLVDLAGSERTARSGAEGQRMKEACAINKSLSSLGDVFMSISRGDKHIPYRNSKLTHLLAPCLGGDGKTLMMVNVAPEPESAEESMHSLKFAAQVNAVELGGGKTRAKRNVTYENKENAGANVVVGPAAAAAAKAGDKARRSSMMPLPPGALARRASMAVGKRAAGADLNGRAAKR